MATPDGSDDGIELAEERWVLPLAGLRLREAGPVNGALRLLLTGADDARSELRFTTGRLFYHDRRCATVHPSAASHVDAVPYLEGSFDSLVDSCSADLSTGLLTLTLDDGFRVEAVARDAGWRIEGPQPLLVVGQPDGQVEHAVKEAE
jgi:hypothetical protein